MTQRCILKRNTAKGVSSGLLGCSKIACVTVSVTPISLSVWMDAKKRKCVWSLDHGPLKVVISINTGWVYKREEEH